MGHRMGARGPPTPSPREQPGATQVPGGRGHIPWEGPHTPVLPVPRDSHTGSPRTPGRPKFLLVPGPPLPQRPAAPRARSPGAETGESGAAPSFGRFSPIPRRRPVSRPARQARPAGGGWPGGSGMRLLFLAVLRPHTGNAVTARRVRAHLEAEGHVCLLRDASDFAGPKDVAELVRAEAVQAALALHLYRAGRLLQGHGIPFGVVFGGTDLNEDVRQGDKHRAMGAVLEEARFAVAFTEAMRAAACRQWPHAKDKICVQGQGIATAPNAAFAWGTFLQRAGIPQSADALHVFLLICGLRPVKDPLFLVDAFAEWHREEPGVYLVIVGPEVDPVFTREVKAKVERAAGVRLLPEMPQADLHAAEKNCLALVNSSLSEGMSAAILEAMDLEVPVLARNIPGNAAVVQHGVTGLLFSDPQEFVQLARRLVRDPELGAELVARGREYVRTRHCWRAERDTYQRLVRSLEGGAARPAC